jgi:shikimate kinase
MINRFKLVYLERAVASAFNAEIAEGQRAQREIVVPSTLPLKPGLFNSLSAAVSAVVPIFQSARAWFVSGRIDQVDATL